MATYAYLMDNRHKSLLSNSILTFLSVLNLVLNSLTICQNGGNAVGNGGSRLFLNKKGSFVSLSTLSSRP